MDYHAEKARIEKRFDALWNDVKTGRNFPKDKPLLAHYTTITVLEKMFKDEELWFSHPYHMNDLDELRFGLIEGAEAFRQDGELRTSCGSMERYAMVQHLFAIAFEGFLEGAAFDTYVFCMSEHDPKNTDGLLSMWRGYGGNGLGAAIVFDTAQINNREDTPLTIAPVAYGSAEERRGWIRDRMAQFNALLREGYIVDEQLGIPTFTLFNRLRQFALFSKHCGFLEEKEWRAVYSIEQDVYGRLRDKLDYAIGRSGGLEPRLKFKMGPIKDITAPDFGLEKVVKQIILGPSVATPLAVQTVRRMLHKVGKGGLVDRVVASSTPYRAAP